MRSFSDNETKQIIQLYNDGLTSLKICTLFRTSKKTILDLLRNNNVLIRPNGSVRKYSLDEYYFNTIDTPNKAQILGMLFADGCLVECNNSIQIQLSEKDKDYLDFIKRELKTNKPLVEKKSKKFISPSNKREYIRNKSFCLTIRSMTLYNSCLNLGLISRKSSSITKLPDIPIQFLKSFILGFFEGDGNVYYNKKCRVSRFNILCQENIGDEIIKIIKEYTGVILQKRFWGKTKKHLNLFYIETQKKRDIEILFEWLYKDSEFYMERKHHIFKNIIGNKAEPIKELIS